MNRTRVLAARLLAFVCVLFAAPGCASLRTSEVNGVAVYDVNWAQTKAALAPKIAFETGCKPEQIGFTLLRAHGGYALEVGVDACGEHLIYVRTPTETSDGQWSLEAARRQ